MNSSNSDSCDSNLTSPTSPESIHYPDTYILPKPELSKDAEIKSEEAFDFGTFEDWMRWDDLDAGFSPTATSFFPEVKTESMSPGMSRLELQRGPISKSSFDSRALAEESVVFIEDPVSGPLFQTPDLMEMASSPVNQGSEPEGLYSTPLAWSTPIPGRAQSQNGDMLSPQEAEELRNIAMPPSTQAPPERKHYPTSPESSSASPEPSHKKRKSSLEDDYSDFEQESSPVTNGNGGRHPPVKKTAHNMIEKRYRTNLNDKIAALRASVPSLRVMTKKNSRGEELHEDLQGLTPAHKLNKVRLQNFLRSHSHSILNLYLRVAKCSHEEQELTTSTGNSPLESNRIHRTPRKTQQVPDERECRAEIKS